MTPRMAITCDASQHKLAVDDLDIERTDAQRAVK